MYRNIINKKVIVMNEFETAAYVMAAANLINDPDFDDITFEEVLEYAPNVGAFPLADDQFDTWSVAPACANCIYDTNRIANGSFYYVSARELRRDISIFNDSWMLGRGYNLSYIDYA